MKMAQLFQLPVKKGDYPHSFSKLENLKYEGNVPADNFYLSFGQTKLSSATEDYLKERRSSNEPWNLAKELYEYSISDCQILQKGCQVYLQQNFEFQACMADDPNPCILEQIQHSCSILQGLG